jgi:hypothetical protein
MRGWATSAVLIVATIAVSSAASAHHSFAEFNTQRTIEIVGEVTEIRWRNPHVTAKVAVTNGAGAIESWDLEMESLGMLRRMGVGAEVLNVGDQVRVAGSPSINGSRSMYAQNILLPSGEELVTRGAPRYSNRLVGDVNSWAAANGSPAHPELGLFRVWSTTMASLLTQVADPAAAPVDPLTLLTPAAQRAIAAFDPVASSRSIGCNHKGMPRIMQQPDDMAFAQNGEDILLQIEEYDTVREIDMSPDADRTSRPLSTLGYSTGAWEGRTLVVTTTNVAEPVTQWALPQSDRIETVERFTPSEDGSRLDYRLTVTDPTYFNGPLHFAKYWIALEGAQIDPYDCVE